MAMVFGLDLHRRQITFDMVEVDSGQEWRGWIGQPNRELFRRWLRGDVTRRARGGPVALAVEGCTGWRCVVEEIESAGFEAHVSAAGSDPDAAALLDEQTRQTQEGQGLIARSLARAGALRPKLRERDAADIIHALMSPEVYRLLVLDRGWQSERYEGG
jgi:hypothetical protein